MNTDEKKNDVKNDIRQMAMEIDDSSIVSPNRHSD